MTSSQDCPLLPILHERIQAHGALTVADYMELALGHPQHGYYMARDPLGEHGDFVTAPEISQIFGELMGAWLAAMWQMLGEREMVLVELGGGRGTLMSDALRATRHVAGFHESLVITMVDSSPTLRRFQRAVLAGHHPRMVWQPNLENLPDLPLLFVANEFFDALPIRQYVKTPTGLQERFITLGENNALTFVTQATGLQLVKGGTHVIDESQDEQIIESSPASRQVVDQLGAHMAEYGGAGLVIDYGYTGNSRGNTLQAVRKHGFWPVLEQPGQADITAHVAFDALAETFNEHGVVTSPITPQGDFLQAIGGETRLDMLMQESNDEQGQTLYDGYERLVSPQQMGELFKVMGVCSDDDVTMPGLAHD